MWETQGEVAPSWPARSPATGLSKLSWNEHFMVSRILPHMTLSRGSGSGKTSQGCFSQLKRLTLNESLEICLKPCSDRPNRNQRAVLGIPGHPHPPSCIASRMEERHDTPSESWFGARTLYKVHCICTWPRLWMRRSPQFQK